MSPPTFNLIDQPWIPVETAAGPRRLSLLDTLHRSHTLDGISGDSPLTTAAVFRLLLAVLHAALRGPRSNSERLKLWREGRWDPDTITAYLRRWHDRFDLFHSEWPFYQCGGFEITKPKSVAFIAPELASGNNATLFDHTLETDPPAIDPATAALWLIRVQTFCLGGLDKSTSNLFGVSPSFYASPASQGAMVMPLGDNLFETLLFNLTPYDATRPFPTRPDVPDLPTWERSSGPQPGPRPPSGYLDYLTWPSRIIRLEPESTEEGDWIVRRVHISQGCQIDRVTLEWDPFLAWRSSAKSSYPLRVSADRSLWRDANALFSFADKQPGAGVGKVGRAAIVGELQNLIDEADDVECRALSVAGLENDQARFICWRHEELPVGRPLLSDPNCVAFLESAIQTGEQVGDHLKNSVREVARGIVKPNEPGGANREDVDRVVDSWQLPERYYPVLEAPFNQLLAALAEATTDSERDAALLSWRSRVCATARGAFVETTQLAGSDWKALKAVTSGSRLLNFLLRSHQPEKPEEKESSE